MTQPNQKPSLPKAARRANRRKNLRELQATAVQKLSGPYYKRPATTLIQTYLDDEGGVDLRNRVKQIEGEANGLTYGALQRMAFAKMGKLNVKSVPQLRKAILDQYNLDTAGIKDMDLVTLVAMDDWSVVAKAAIPIVQKYGPMLLSALYNHFLKPRLDKWMGGDEGINPSDWGGVLGPRRFTPVLGENIAQTGVANVISKSSSYKDVDPRSIKLCLCPELQRHRYAFTQCTKVALGVNTLEYSVVANSSGSVGVTIQSYFIIGAGTAYNSSAVSIFNDATFSVSTGTQTPTATFNPGFFNGSSSAIESARVVGMAVQVIPTASFNTAGSFTLGYKPRSSGSGYTSTTIGVTLTQLKNWPFVTSFNNKTLARMTTVPGDPDDDEFGTAFFGHNFILLGSGLPASVECAKIVITSVIEFIPTADYLPICVLDTSAPGPMTEQFEAMMYARFPVLQQLDLEDAKRISDSLPDYPLSYDQLMEILSSSVTGIRPRQYVSHTAPIEQPQMVGSLPELIVE